MNTQLLRFELLRLIRAAHPNATTERMEKLAGEIEATGAYQHDGARVVPAGDRDAMTRAARIAPLVCSALTASHVDATSAASRPETRSLDRARARFRAMTGGDLDTALDGGDDAPIGNFYGLSVTEINSHRRPPKGAA